MRSFNCQWALRAGLSREAFYRPAGFGATVELPPVGKSGLITGLVTGAGWLVDGLAAGAA